MSSQSNQRSVELLQANALDSINLEEFGDSISDELYHALAKTTGLRHLSWNNINLPLQAVWRLSEVINSNAHLQVLTLYNAHIGDEGCRLICAALENNRTISIVHLQHNNIGGVGANALARLLRINRSIQQLNVAGNMNVREHAAAIAEALSQNHTLLHLDLTRCGVTDDAAQVFQRVLATTNQYLREIKIAPENAADHRVVAILSQISAVRPSFQVIIDMNQLPLQSLYNAAAAAASAANNARTLPPLSSHSNNLMTQRQSNTSPTAHLLPHFGEAVAVASSTMHRLAPMAPFLSDIDMPPTDPLTIPIATVLPTLMNGASIMPSIAMEHDAIGAHAAAMAAAGAMSHANSTGAIDPNAGAPRRPQRQSTSRTRMVGSGAEMGSEMAAIQRLMAESDEEDGVSFAKKRNKKKAPKKDRKSKKQQANGDAIDPNNAQQSSPTTTKKRRYFPGQSGGDESDEEVDNGVPDEHGLKNRKLVPMLRSNQVSAISLQETCFPDILYDAMLKCTSIEEIHWNQMQLSVDVVSRIGELVRRKPTIRYLSLYKAKIGDDGCKELCRQLMDTRTLVYLNLYQNALGTEAMRSLSQLFKVNSSIKELSLSGNWFKDEGVELFLPALETNRTLESLNLSCCGIKERGLKMLIHILTEKNSTLRKLTLLSQQNHKMDADMVRQLQEAMATKKGFVLTLSGERKRNPNPKPRRKRSEKEGKEGKDGKPKKKRIKTNLSTASTSGAMPTTATAVATLMPGMESSIDGKMVRSATAIPLTMIAASNAMSVPNATTAAVGVGGEMKLGMMDTPTKARNNKRHRNDDFAHADDDEEYSERDPQRPRSRKPTSNKAGGGGGVGVAGAESPRIKRSASATAELNADGMKTKRLKLEPLVMTATVPGNTTLAAIDPSHAMPGVSQLPSLSSLMQPIAGHPMAVDAHHMPHAGVQHAIHPSTHAFEPHDELFPLSHHVPSSYHFSHGDDLALSFPGELEHMLEADGSKKVAPHSTEKTSSTGSGVHLQPHSNPGANHPALPFPQMHLTEWNFQ